VLTIFIASCTKSYCEPPTRHTTTLEAYEALGVPEVWIYRNYKLRICLLQEGEYVQSAISPTFPDLAIIKLIPELVQQSINELSAKCCIDG
jgi:Uma2 family endonuclease